MSPGVFYLNGSQRGPIRRSGGRGGGGCKANDTSGVRPSFIRGSAWACTRSQTEVYPEIKWINFKCRSGAFLQTPAPVLDKISGPKGARFLSNTGLGTAGLQKLKRCCPNPLPKKSAPTHRRSAVPLSTSAG